jgi:hypothetical protein
MHWKSQLYFIPLYHLSSSTTVQINSTAFFPTFVSTASAECAQRSVITVVRLLFTQVLLLKQTEA